ncbi:MAG: glycosyltransferase family 39 protein [Leptolyngbyaceae cyanobacterium MO_188.B28]|nr:glycosyltransferase family 39 protein [Leptolyngbyaceae cyanobacterium MO_188.B28]
MKSLEQYGESVSRHWRVILISILVIGCLIRLYGIDWGLPYLYDSDEPIFVSAAYHILSNRDLNPHWFGAPATTVIYMLAGLYTLIFFIGRGLGFFASPGDFQSLYFQDPTIFYLSGRLISAVFGIATIIIIYLIGTKIFNRTIGFMAALFITINPLHVNYSKLVRMDVLMTFLILLALWYCLKILENNSLSNYILASFFMGLAIATKYPAVIFTITIVLTYIISNGWQSRRYLKPISSTIACIAGAFLGSPFLFLDFQRVLLDVTKENRTQHLSGTGEGLIQNIIWYFQNTLSESFTFYGLLFIGIGFILCLASKQKDRWLLISFPPFFLLFISSLNLRWDRWLIPIIPFGCILLAYGIHEVAKWIEHRINIRMGFCIVLISLVILSAPLLSVSIVQGREKSGIDTRTMAGQWMISNLPTGSSVLVESSAPQLPKKSFKFFRVSSSRKALVEIDPEKIQHEIFRPRGHIGRIRDVEDIKRKNIEYVVMSNKYDRYLRERERYPDIINTYEELMASGSLIYEVKRIPKVNTGPRIHIYKVRP